MRTALDRNFPALARAAAAGKPLITRYFQPAVTFFSGVFSLQELYTDNPWSCAVLTLALFRSDLLQCANYLVTFRQLNFLMQSVCHFLGAVG